MGASGLGPPNAIVVENLVKDYAVRLLTTPKSISGRIRNAFWPRMTVKTALRGIGLVVPQGQILGFIGPNGAGKTSMVKILCGILTPTSGHVEVLGFNPQKQRYRYTYHIGLVFGQRSLLWYDIPVVESLRLYADVYDIGKDALKRKIEQFSDLLGIGGFLHVPVRKLSLGQRMRAEVAASLLHDPEILFLDEPTVGLDAVAKESIRGFLSQVNREKGTTVFLTTHDMNDVEALCDRVVIIDDGATIYDGSVDALKAAEREKILEVRLRPGENNGAKVTRLLSLLSPYAEEPVTAQSICVRLRIPEDKALAVVSEILSLDVLQDLNIQPPRLDSVIRKIYEGSAAGHVS